MNEPHYERPGPPAASAIPPNTGQGESATDTVDPTPEDLATVSEAIISEFPEYRSHKIVRAAKITSISPKPDRFPESFGLDFGKHGYLYVPKKWFLKHSPVTGGYFVVYADGYWSFSPASAFEDGYIAVAPTLIPPECPSQVASETAAVAGNSPVESARPVQPEEEVPGEPVAHTGSDPVDSASSPSASPPSSSPENQ